jgi:hypothetical protein
VNYDKLDPSLAMALDDDDASSNEFVVFIEVTKPLTPQDAENLRRLGVSAATAGESLLTASLNHERLARVSELASVRSLKLSQRLAMRRAPYP